MIRELELHRKAPNTIKPYVAAMVQLAEHYHRSPDAISIEEIRDFLHHLITVRKVAYSTCNQKVAAIRFFYRHVLGWQDFQLRVPAKRSGRLPEPLSRGEIGRLFDVTTNTKHRMLLMTAYGGGLRVSELVCLKPTDIHSERKLIRVDQGKGRKDRYTLLSPRLLEELRAYWSEYRPQAWLFEGRYAGRHLAAATAAGVFKRAKLRSGLQHGGGIHCLRHTFAVHRLLAWYRDGQDVNARLPWLATYMGHVNIHSTQVYLRPTAELMEQVDRRFYQHYQQYVQSPGDPS